METHVGQVGLSQNLFETLEQVVWIPRDTNRCGKNQIIFLAALDDNCFFQLLLPAVLLQLLKRNRPHGVPLVTELRPWFGEHQFLAFDALGLSLDFQPAPLPIQIKPLQPDELPFSKPGGQGQVK
jgi:hypothetical protein